MPMALTCLPAVQRFQHLVKAWTHVKRTPAAAAPTGSKPTALTAPSVLLESESPQAELRVLTNETVPPSPNGRVRLRSLS